MTSSRTSVAALAVLCLLQVVLANGNAHGHGHGHDSSADQPKPESHYAPTYFALADHAATLYAHIVLMTVAWIFVLPVTVMLSIARSRYTLTLRIVFVVVNAAGVLLAIIYNANTPDLYPNNAHHKVAWVGAAIVGVQAGIGLLGHFAGVLGQSPAPARGYRSYMPITAASMAERERLQYSDYGRLSRLSNDSGQGTEPNTESLRSESISSAGQSSPRLSEEARKEYGDDLEDGPIMPTPTETRPSSKWRKVTDKISTRMWKGLILGYDIVDRIVLPFGFVAICTGIVTYGRFFEGSAIYSGLAHWVKGGIFFWLGLFTLGRWSGSFGELGWAWNVRPRKPNSKWRPSAEFVESFLIFVYGATNIFMEHLGGAGGPWTAQDLEHVSITVLFIGGGLLGMLIESTRVRTLLNATVDEAIDPATENLYNDEESSGVGSESALKRPPSYEFSINPIPALVILLLGIMMSSHTQHTMISSMVHKQWGNLLTGASFARALSYVIMYLKPPRSVYPSRPPTELLTAFGLIAGGIIFMASATDTIEGMIHYELDAMFMYTVTMGLVGLLMAWVITVLAIKGWAVRKEASRQKLEH